MFFVFYEEGDVQVRKKLYVPRVEDKNCHMRMLNISCIDDLVANSMNILEPAPIDADGNEREDGNVSLILGDNNFSDCSHSLLFTDS